MGNPVQLHLARHADTAWTHVIRPWLEAGRGRLERTFVIVATRGQAHGLKQRCLVEDVPLLGVEFLTPGLARQKWAALLPGQKPAMGRELLLLGLRTLVARRLAAATPADPNAGVWQSLQSDLERALDDFDELLKAGFGAEDFPLRALQDVFGELTQWVEAHGYELSPRVAHRAGTAPLDAATPPLGGRVLVCGLGPETWGEFFNVAAFVRRCTEVTAVLPEPEFLGRAEQDERWIELWGRFLGVEPEPLDALPPDVTCEAVGAAWLREGGAGNAARILVGRTRADEMQRVACEVGQWLETGAENIAIIFPRADAAHLQLRRALQVAEIPFCDLLEAASPPPVDVQAQRALLTFYAGGARVDDLLELWPLLRAVGAATLPFGEARRSVEHSFDTTQTHSTSAHVAGWEKGAPELARLAAILLPAWPDELTLAEALVRFRGVCDALDLESPLGWGALDGFAQAHLAPLPLAVLTAALASFLPEKAPAKNAAAGSGFARVTLTTRRRAEGLAWSHVVFAESNAGVWPERREPGGWLSDEQRAGLNASRPGSLGLFTADDRAAVERAAYAALTRDTREEVIFSAALFAEEEPEVQLAPNSWLERVWWAQDTTGSGDFGAMLETAARVVGQPSAPFPDLVAWHRVWHDRRDPALPFDGNFFAGDPVLITPEKLSARLIERGVQDPAEIWFDAVLRAPRVSWEPLVRAHRKALGLRAHELLAAAIRPTTGTVRGFGEMPEHGVARTNLAAALRELRTQWPADRYWDSFYAELTQVCAGLLENVYALEGAGRFVATETRLPAAAHLRLGARMFPVTGRLDLVRLDRPEWRGATVDIVDFKTGGDAELSAARMAHTGASLQLGVYLEAISSLGAAAARVWMIKPAPGAMTRLDFSDMKLALAKLHWLETALTRGVYGALTRDRSDYAPEGCVWPLASTPVSRSVLDAKFALTFGAGPGEEADE